MERHTAGRHHYSPAAAVATHPNGRPPLKPYVYRGDGTGMTQAEVEERIAAARALIAGRPDVPGVAALAKVLAPPAPEVPAPRPAPRCRKCGYLRSRCACGGAR